MRFQGFLRTISRASGAGRDFALIVGLLVAFLPGGASGQEAEPLRREGVEIHYLKRHRNLAIDLLDAWPMAVARVQSMTAANPPPLVRIELVPSAEELRERVNALLGHEPPRWVAGVALPGRDLILIRTDLNGPWRDRGPGLLMHELCHLAVRASLAGTDAVLPRWLDEGIAQFVEGRSFHHQVPDLAMRAYFRRLIPLQELEREFPASEGASALAYAESESFVRFLVRRPGDAGIPRLLEALRDGLSLDEALQDLTRCSFKDLEVLWTAELRGDKSWIPSFLIQAFFAIFLLFAVALGILRIGRRRRIAEEKWRAEEGEDDSDHDWLDDDEDAKPPKSSRQRAGPRIRRLEPGEDAPRA